MNPLSIVKTDPELETIKVHQTHIKKKAVPTNPIQTICDKGFLRPIDEMNDIFPWSINKICDFFVCWLIKFAIFPLIAYQNQHFFRHNKLTKLRIFMGSFDEIHFSEKKLFLLCNRWVNVNFFFPATDYWNLRYFSATYRRKTVNRTVNRKNCNV